MFTLPFSTNLIIPKMVKKVIHIEKRKIILPEAGGGCGLDGVVGGKKEDIYNTFHNIEFLKKEKNVRLPVFTLVLYLPFSNQYMHYFKFLTVNIYNI